MRVGNFIPKPVETISSLPDDLGRQVKATWIEPVDESLIRGDLKNYADKVGVKPARIPGYWYFRDRSMASNLPAKENERVALMLHGGGFMMQSAHPSDVSQNITRGILGKSTAFDRIIAVEYRRMYGIDEQTGPKAAKDTFPTALLDALSAYVYLVSTLGFRPENIVLIGDSAGGNLATALTRYLISVSTESPLLKPGGLILLSPWLDLGPSHHGPGSSFRRFTDTDFTGGMPHLEESMLMGGQAYTHPFGDGFCAENPYISPALKLLPRELIDGGSIFSGYPPTLIVAGGAEVLLDSIITTVLRLRQDIGEENVQYLQCEDAFHDFLMFPFAEPERSHSLLIIAQWLEKIKSHSPENS